MRYLIIFLLFTSTIGIGQISESDQELISSICEKYASCSTYQDSGYVEQTTTLLKLDHQAVSRDSFTTVFSREDAFRFMYNDYYNDTTISFKAIIHQDMDNAISTVYKRFSQKKSEIEKTHFLLSLSSLVGVTHGISKYSFGLLLPFDDNMNFNLLKSKLGKFERIEDGQFEEEDCYKFKITYEFDNNKANKNFPPPFKVEDTDEPDIACIENVFWFSKKDLLLKKVEKLNRNKASISKIVIIYHPIMNEKIDPQLLEPNFPEN